MNRLMLTLATLTLALAAHAKPAAKPKKDCADCKSAQELTRQISKLDYNKGDDRAVGTAKVMDAVPLIEKVSAMPKASADRRKLFGEVLNLSREASPFDSEGSIAQTLAQTIAKDAGLKSAYEASIKMSSRSTVKAERCKAKNLDAGVTEALCTSKAGVKGQDMSKDEAKKAEACTQKFNYETCLKE